MLLYQENYWFFPEWRQGFSWLGSIREMIPDASMVNSDPASVHAVEPHSLPMANVGNPTANDTTMPQNNPLSVILLP